MVGLAALTAVALGFVVLALHRSSNLAKASAATPPGFPAAVSASSVPLVVSGSARASIHAVSSGPARPLAAFLGDAYTVGDGASSGAMTWVSLVAANLGWRQENFSVGGTGYSTRGTQAGGTPYTARIAALAATAPSIVIVAGGRADVQSSNSPAQIKSAVTATFAALRAALPTATILAQSPFWASTKPPAAVALIAADVESAVVTVGGRYLDVGQPLVGAPADLGPNPNVPNDAGYAAIATAFEAAYRSQQ